MSFLDPTALPTRTRSWLVALVSNYPVSSSVITFLSAAGVAIVVVEYFGEGFPAFQGDAIIGFVGFASFSLGLSGLLLVPTLLVPNARARDLAAAHETGRAWQAYLPDTLRRMLRAREASQRATSLHPILLLLTDEELSLWQHRRRSLVQLLRVERRYVIDCDLVDISLWVFSDSGIAISVVNPEGGEMTRLDLWPILAGIGSSGDIRSNEFNAQAAQSMLHKWIGSRS
ncbi:MAG: hypothetical protein ACOH1T_07960 [Microbacteriaceae bacterium]